MLQIQACGLLSKNAPPLESRPLLLAQKKQQICPAGLSNIKLPVTNNQLPVTSYQLPVTNYQLTITNEHLSIIIHP